MGRVIVFIDYDVLLRDVLELPEDVRVIKALDSERAQAAGRIEIVIQHENLTSGNIGDTALRRFHLYDGDLKRLVTGEDPFTYDPWMLGVANGDP